MYVAKQIGLHGGLGKKREDWMERYHITNRQWIHFLMTNDKEVRAIVVVHSMQQCTNPEVETWGAKANDKARRGPRQHYIHEGGQTERAA